MRFRKRGDLCGEIFDELFSRLLPAVLLAAFSLPVAGAGADPPPEKLETGASIVWDTDAQGRMSEFIIRIAEFSPDRYFEWESRAQQGTIRIPADVLANSVKMTFARLFDNGVEIERADFLTLWLSRAVYDELKGAGRIKINKDSLQDEFILLETVQYPLQVDRRPLTVSALKMKDSRGGVWIFLDSPENPVMLQYQSKYFLQKVRSMTTRGNILRWIRH